MNDHRGNDHRSHDNRGAGHNGGNPGGNGNGKRKFRSKQPWKSDSAARGVTAPNSGRAQVHRKG